MGEHRDLVGHAPETSCHGRLCSCPGQCSSSSLAPAGERCCCRHLRQGPRCCCWCRGWWGSGEHSFVPNNFHSSHGHVIWIGIVTVGKTTVVLRSFSQQLIILTLQNNALTFNQNMSGFIFHSFKFILLKGITAILSIRCFLLGLPFCNEDASTSLQDLMFCSHYRSSIFSSIHTTCLACLPALQTSLLSFKS